MNIGLPWFGNNRLGKDDGTTFKPTSVLVGQSNQKPWFDIRVLGWSLLSVLPWAIDARDKIRMPTTINRGLRKHAKPRGVVEDGLVVNPLRFRPYVSKVPWHTGPRAFLSQLFPRYGHYCGPNWSSGKNSGTPLWDQRPIDWLDYCCYCHDIGYDSHDQADLLKADLAFLECLERPNMITKGDSHVALLYKTMCITGLKNFLIPYRRHLLKLRAGQPIFDFVWMSTVKWRRINLQKT
ncbi:hypothetical protein CFOL_v3_05645 [Cephalotus follicularis]|uniref:Phospholipase A2 domain-containing protein n=1 Tax=Cephalotus follicularis TaxID=3775 RepID=A0A1Q3B279_CEPFO|nr:hypothetical protein CFOL_v3_05645 [Cephalotus follicularis]